VFYVCCLAGDKRNTPIQRKINIKPQRSSRLRWKKLSDFNALSHPNSAYSHNWRLKSIRKVKWICPGTRCAGTMIDEMQTIPGVIEEQHSTL
jgi:hypothetical protein